MKNKDGNKLKKVLFAKRKEYRKKIYNALLSEQYGGLGNTILEIYNLFFSWIQSSEEEIYDYSWMQNAPQYMAKTLQGFFYVLSQDKDADFSGRIHSFFSKHINEIKKDTEDFDETGYFLLSLLCNRQIPKNENSGLIASSDPSQKFYMKPLNRLIYLYFVLLQYFVDNNIAAGKYKTAYIGFKVKIKQLLKKFLFFSKNMNIKDNEANDIVEKLFLLFQESLRYKWDTPSDENSLYVSPTPEGKKIYSDAVIAFSRYVEERRKINEENPNPFYKFFVSFVFNNTPDFLANSDIDDQIFLSALTIEKEFIDRQDILFNYYKMYILKKMNKRYQEMMLQRAYAYVERVSRNNNIKYNSVSKQECLRLLFEHCIEMEKTILSGSWYNVQDYIGDLELYGAEKTSPLFEEIINLAMSLDERFVEKIISTRRKKEVELIEDENFNLGEYRYRFATGWRTFLDDEEVVKKAETRIALDPELNLKYLQGGLKDGWLGSILVVKNELKDKEEYLQELMKISEMAINKLFETGNFTRQRSEKLFLCSYLLFKKEGAESLLNLDKINEWESKLSEIADGNYLSEVFRDIQYSQLLDKPYCLYNEILPKTRKKIEQKVLLSEHAVYYICNHLMVGDYQITIENHPLFNEDEKKKIWKNINKNISQNVYNAILFAQKYLRGPLHSFPDKISPKIAKEAEEKIAQQEDDKLFNYSKIMGMSWFEAGQKGFINKKIAENAEKVALGYFDEFESTNIENKLKYVDYIINHYGSVENLPQEVTDIILKKTGRRYEQYKNNFYNFVVSNVPYLYAVRSLKAPWCKATFVDPSFRELAETAIANGSSREISLLNQYETFKFYDYKADLPLYLSYAKNLLRKPWSHEKDIAVKREVIESIETLEKMDPQYCLQYHNFVLNYGGWHGPLYNAKTGNDAVDAICSSDGYKVVVNDNLGFLSGTSSTRNWAPIEFLVEYVKKTMINNSGVGYTFFDLLQLGIVEHDLAFYLENIILQEFPVEELIYYIKNHVREPLNKSRIFIFAENKEHDLCKEYIKTVGTVLTKLSGQPFERSQDADILTSGSQGGVGGPVSNTHREHDSRSFSGISKEQDGYGETSGLVKESYRKTRLELKEVLRVMQKMGVVKKIKKRLNKVKK